MKKLLAVVLLLSVLTRCTPAHEEVVVDSKSSGIVNADLTNDLAFLYEMDTELMKMMVNIDDFHEEGGFFHATPYYSYKGYIQLAVNTTYNIVSGIYIDYTKLPNRDDASLLGINGYDTFDTIVERFGKDYVYPYIDRVSGRVFDEKEIKKDCCCIVMSVSARDGYRANFDENGQMTAAFIIREL